MESLPSKDRILEWIAENPDNATRREIATAFGIRGAGRIDLGRLLREIAAEGRLPGRSKRLRGPGRLPPVSILEVLEADEDGDLWARPTEWPGGGELPRILMVARPGERTPGPGERVLARVSEVEGLDHDYEGRLLRRVGEAPHRVVGIFRKAAEGGRILPVDRGSDQEWAVPAGATLDAKDGELVEAEQAPGPRRLGLPQARIVERVGDPSAPKAVSLIAIHQHGIPDDFPDAAIAEADAAQPAGPEGREDLRDLPLVTIDPTDARDRDDAVLALPDDDPRNPGGHVIWVAIADVAHYVTPGSALDREARNRGNSTYFPDRVVPMLPDRLSGDLCSLHEGVDRACLAVRMQITAKGVKLSHRFMRATMRSTASLCYEEVQAARDGEPDARLAPMKAGVIDPLYDAYNALAAARSVRQPLELDLPERRIVISDAGRVTSVSFRERLDAHRLIEEFMVLANVAAAEELNRLKQPLLFRVHEEPSPEKLEALREVAQASGLVLAKGQVLRTEHLNRLLAQAAGTDQDELINIATLRAMQQAYYAPQNFGHFGLALRNYAHFTSPIRRYSDLIVHRALITAHGWGEDGLSPEDRASLDETAEQVSLTERRSMLAERDTTDRYLALYLTDRVGTEMPGRISGVQRFGVFVRLDESGADGLVPVRTIGREYFHFDASSQTLVGSDSGMTLALGQRVIVRLTEAAPVTGGLLLELVEAGGKDFPKPSARGKGGDRRKGKAAKDKASRKAGKRTVGRRR